MGLLDTIKGAFKGKGKQAEAGIDKVADVVDDKTGGSNSSANAFFLLIEFLLY